MTPGLRINIQCHACPYFFLNLQIPRSDIRPDIKLDVSLVIEYGQFNLPRGFCVGMYGLTYSLYHPRGKQRKAQSIALKTSAFCFISICKAVDVGALCSYNTGGTPSELLIRKCTMLNSPNIHTNYTTRKNKLASFTLYMHHDHAFIRTPAIRKSLKWSANP